MKARLKGAQTGRNLLKKKSDALTLRFRQILKKIIETKMLMGEVMREAAFSLAEAKFTAGDFSTTVIQNVNKAQVKIRAKKDNVAGVTLPVFEHYQEGGDSKYKTSIFYLTRTCGYFILIQKYFSCHVLLIGPFTS